MQAFNALIVLLDGPSGGRPDQGLPGHQPIAGWGPGFPTNPIAPGGPPPVAGWTPPGHQPGQGLPGQPPVAGQGPGFPTNPIVIPPGALGDGKPTLPIVIPPSPPVAGQGPGFPTNPIVIPPGTLPGISNPIVLPPEMTHPIAPGGQPGGGGGGGQPPIASTGPGFPTNPIVIPPAPPTAQGDKALVLVLTSGNEPVWLVIDKNDGVKPTHPQPKHR